jgi:hypothetical protein
MAHGYKWGTASTKCPTFSSSIMVSASWDCTTTTATSHPPRRMDPIDTIHGRHSSHTYPGSSLYNSVLRSFFRNEYSSDCSADDCSSVKNGASASEKHEFKSANHYRQTISKARSSSTQCSGGWEELRQAYVEPPRSVDERVERECVEMLPLAEVVVQGLGWRPQENCWHHVNVWVNSDVVGEHVMRVVLARPGGQSMWDCQYAPLQPSPRNNRVVHIQDTDELTDKPARGHIHTQSDLRFLTAWRYVWEPGKRRAAEGGQRTTNCGQSR